MKFSYRWAPASVVTLGLVLGGSLSVRALAQNYYGSPAYPAPYSNLRGLIDRTQNDLRVAVDLEHEKADQRERFEHAQGHLSTFDRHLIKGKFDKGELDKAIGSIRGILDHNVLQASTRDVLLRDEADLRVARDRRY